MRNARTRWAAAVTGMLTLSLAACGGGGDTGSAAAPTSYSGEPVTIEFWGSLPNLKGLADEYNKQGGPITVKFVEQPGNVELHKNLRNAVAAGGGPCVFDTITESLTSLASGQVAADLTESGKPYEKEYSPTAWQSVKAGNQVFALPAASIPNFMLYNAPAFKNAGIPYPKTWEEFVEDGKKFAAKGIKIYNLAGEDYTTYVYLAWQAGARWWQAADNGWKVNVDSPQTAKAASILQQLIDNDSVQKISYAEFASMMREYNDGKIVSRQLSTWQTQSMQKRLTTGNGQWEPAPNPTFAGDAPANVSFNRAYALSSQCAHPDAAMQFAHWASTNENALKLIADPAKGQSWFPAIADPTPYIAATQPTKLLGDNAAKWEPVVKDAVTSQKGDWTYGPNAEAAFKALQDLWGKAVAKEIPVASIAPAMQKWIVDDLKRSGITVVS
jgi:multiple sugar transport system substrate-binding protein